MAIFNSYVKLPEGVQFDNWRGAWRIGRIALAQSWIWSNRNSSARFSLGEGPKKIQVHTVFIMTKQNQSSLRILEYPLVI